MIHREFAQQLAVVGYATLAYFIGPIVGVNVVEDLPAVLYGAVLGVFVIGGRMALDQLYGEGR